MSGDRTADPSPETGSGRALWEEHAGWWQDHFTAGADPEYTEQIIPLALEWLGGEGRVLDLGTGEGQVARALAATGASVTGIDPTRAQVAVATERAGGPDYAVAEAGGLPFGDRCFDAAVACLVFEHIAELDRGLAEIARVLRPGGRFVLFLNHAIIQAPDSGWIDDHVLDPPERYWRLGPYLTERSLVEEVEPGVWIPFEHRPISRYVNAMADVGLGLERMLEPAPPEGFLARAAEYAEAADYPRLLVLIAVRLHSGDPATARQ